MLSSTVLICLACGGCFACLLLLIGNLSNRHADQANERLQSLAKIRDDSPNRRTTPNSAKESARAEERGSAAYFKRLLHQLVPNKKSDQLAHQSRLFHAGIYHPSALWRYFACKLLLMIAPPLLGWFAGAQGFISLRFGLLLGGTAGAFGMILPSLWLDRRIKIRHKQLRRSLPDFLDLMIVCLDGGLSLQGAIQRVSDEFQLAHPILAREMQTVQRDVDLGATIEVSLRNLAERTGLDSLRTLSSFVRESLRFGTQLAEAIRQHAEMLRVQREQSAEEQAQRAAVYILLPTLLLILPAVFVVVAGPAGIQVHQAFNKRRTP